MTPTDLKAWRQRNGYSQGQLAKLLGVIPLTVSRWELGVREIPSFLHLALECLEMKGGEWAKGVIEHKPGQYLPLSDRLIIVREEPEPRITAGTTKKKAKKKAR